MNEERLQIADLTPEQLAKLQELETDLGKLVVALQPAHRIARLSDEQLTKLQDIEHEMGVVLLAYEKK